MEKKILLFLLFGVFLSLLFSKIELSMGFTGLIIILGQFYYLKQIKDLLAGSLAIFYSLGTVFCWVLGLLSCLYLLPNADFVLGTQITTTMILVNLSLLASLVGTILGFSVFRRSNLKSEKNKIKIPEETTWAGVWITLTIFLAYLIISYLGGILTARSSLGSILSPDSVLYFTSALAAVQYLFFFFLGAYMHKDAFSHRSIAIILVLIASGFILALPGGRETALRVIFIFLAGVLFSGLQLKNFRFLAISSMIFAALIVFIIGYVRSYGDFQQISIKDRVDIIVSYVKDRQPLYNNEYDSPVYSIFTRIAEPSGQVVIDSVSQGNKYAGFVNFDRLRYLYIPKFINADKPAIDDGKERLFTDFNVPFSDLSARPITLLADSFARWGYAGAFLVSLILAFILSLIGQLFCSFKNRLFSIVLLVYFSSVCIRIYAMSVLGTINTVFYIFLRDFIIIALMVYAINRIAFWRSGKNGGV